MRCDLGLAMKSLLDFLKTTLLGGVAIVLPIWLLALLALEAVGGVLALLQPIAAVLPQKVLHPDLVAIGLMAALCFLAGLPLRTRVGSRIGASLERRVLDRIPGYSLLRNVARSAIGQDNGRGFQPALVVIEDALVPAFIVERLADGQCTVFVPASPTPATGAIYILPGARVHALDVPLRRALTCVTRWGEGSGELLAAIRPQPAGLSGGG